MTAAMSNGIMKAPLSVRSAIPVANTKTPTKITAAMRCHVIRQRYAASIRFAMTRHSTAPQTRPAFEAPFRGRRTRGPRGIIGDMKDPRRVEVSATEVRSGPTCRSNRAGYVRSA